MIRPKKIAMPLLVMLAMAACSKMLHADTLQWQVPNFGTVNLNLTTTEAVIGYGAVSKQAIGGFSLPVYTDPKGIITLELGAVSPWPIQSQATVEPYISAGHDILKEIPYLNQFTSCHLNIFGRYITDAVPVKADVGLSFSYGFAGGTLPTPAPMPTAPVPSAP